MDNNDDVNNGVVGDLAMNDGGQNQADGHVAVNDNFNAALQAHGPVVVAGHGFFNPAGGVQPNHGGPNPANGNVAVNGNFNPGGGIQANNLVAVAGHGFFNPAGGVQPIHGVQGPVLGNPAVAGNVVGADHHPVGVGAIAGNIEGGHLHHLPANAIDAGIALLPLNALVQFSGEMLAAGNRITTGLQIIVVDANPAQQNGVGQVQQALEPILAFQAQITQNLEEISHERILTILGQTNNINLALPQLRDAALLLGPGFGTVEVNHGVVQLMNAVVEIEGVLALYLQNVANAMINNLVEPEHILWEDEDEDEDEDEEADAEDAEEGEEAQGGGGGFGQVEYLHDAQEENLIDNVGADLAEGGEDVIGQLDHLHNAQAEQVMIGVEAQGAGMAEGGEVAIGQAEHIDVAYQGAGAEEEPVVIGQVDDMHAAQAADINVGVADQGAAVAGGQGVNIVFVNEQQPYNNNDDR